MRADDPLDAFWKSLQAGDAIAPDTWPSHSGDAEGAPPEHLRLLRLLQKLHCAQATESGTEARSTAPATASPPTGLLPRSLPDGAMIHDKFRILALLDRGGMGEVYVAWHEHLEKYVALKLLPPWQAGDADAVERFRRAIAAQAKVGAHPHVVPTLDAGRLESGQPYLVMEYVEGSDLQGMVAQHGPLPWRQAVEFTRQVALGLYHAHRHGLVHRDIKPSNVIVSEVGQVSILDWGLARREAASETDAAKRMTRDGQRLGTLDFMAPEQAEDAAAASVRSDLYSLGCTLYFLLAGHAPFAHRKTPLAKLRAHESEAPPPLTAWRGDLPGDLVVITDRLLEKQPDRRFASANELVKALEWLAAARPLPQANRRRLAGSWMAVGVVSAAVLAGIIYVATDKGRLEIVTHDKDVQVVVAQDGEEVRIVDTKTEETISLRTGDFQIKLASPSAELQLDTDHVTIRRGETAIVEVTKQPPVAAQAADDQRSVAEQFRALGAAISVRSSDGVIHDLVATQPLPEGTFDITSIGVRDCHDLRSSHFELLMRCKQLNALGLDGSDVSSDDIKRLSSISSLRFLSLIGVSGVNDESIEALTGLSLEELLISHTSLTNAGFAAVCEMKSLNRLCLEGLKGVDDHGLASIEALTGLTRLDIRKTRAADEAMKALGTLTRLLEVNLDGNEGITDELVGELANCSGLDKLTLQGTSINGSCLTSLKDLHLTVLSLNECRCFVAEQHIDDLCHFKDLTELGVQAIHLDDAQLAKLSELPRLRLLDLIGNGNIGTTADAFKPLERLTTLQELRLSGTSVDNRHVEQLKKLRTLTHLDVRNTNIDATGVFQLILALFNCEIATNVEVDVDRQAVARFLELGAAIHIQTPDGVEHDLTAGMAGVASMDLPVWCSVTLIHLLNGKDLKPGHFALIAQLKHLRELKLGNSSVSSTSVAELAKCTGLRILALDRMSKVDDAAIAAIATLPLESITLSNIRTSNAALVHLSHTTSLQSLALLGDFDISAQGLLALNSLPNLTGLDLECHNKDYCRAVSQLTRITSLSIRNSDLDDDAVGELSAMSNLRSLFLEDMRINGSCFQDWPDTGLKSLWLRDTKLGGRQSMESLARFKGLQDLNLSQTAVRDDDLVPLAELKHIAVLSLAENPNIGASERALEPLVSMSQLHELHLEGTSVDNQQIQQLAKLGGLRHLNIRRTGIDADGVRQLKEALPDCEIFSDVEADVAR